MPLFSIIIPFYNTEPEYYSKTFDSLKRLPGVTAEVIVVDDGSEASALIGLKEYLGKELPHARLFCKDNGGQNSARQFALERAKGDYVLFLDSDDYIDQAQLLVLADYLSDNRPDVVAFNYDIVGCDGIPVESCCAWEEGFREIGLQRLALASDGLCRQCYCLQRLKELPFELVQGVRIGEDLASALSINLSLRNCVSFGGVLYHYVKRPSSIIHNTPKEAVYDVLDAFDEVIRRSGPVYSGCYNEVEWMAVLHCIGWNSMRLMRAGINLQKGREYTFNWMNERFPDWKQNSYIKTNANYKRIWLCLSTSGHWGLLRLSIRLWDLIKRVSCKIQN